MRHVRLANQHVKNLTTFKKQVGKILDQLKKFNAGEKREAFKYIHKRIPRLSKPKRRKKHGKKTKKRNRPKLYDTRKIVLRRKTILQNERRISQPRPVFECKDCKFTDTIKRTFFKHIEIHVGSPLSCIKCRKTFNSNNSFEWHKTYFCSFRRINKALNYMCDQCPRAFLTKRNLDRHIEGHKRNSCGHCDKIITNRKLLIKHMFKVHSIKLEDAYYKCNYCDKKYIKKHSLYNHYVHHFPHKLICLECGHMTDSVEQFTEHRKIHDRKKYFTCSQCKRKFSRRHQYIAHIKGHDRYKCVTCNEKFASKVLALQHKKKGHLVEGLQPKFLCPTCPSAFFEKSRLQYHLKKHPDEKRLSCKICKKTFSHASYYKHCTEVYHKVNIIDSVDYLCQICDKVFTKQSKLAQHKMQIHNIAPEPYKCKYCEHTSNNKTNMDKHIALHLISKPKYICEICGKAFTNNSSLLDHISFNHKQDKQFKCSLCEKDFKRKSELTRHEASHTNERPYACKLCDKAYKQSTHLRRHEQSAHKIFKSRKIIKLKPQTESVNPPGAIKKETSDIELPQIPPDDRDLSALLNSKDLPLPIPTEDFNMDMKEALDNPFVFLKLDQNNSSHLNCWPNDLITDEDILIYAQNHLIPDIPLDGNEFANIDLLDQCGSQILNTVISDESAVLSFFQNSSEFLDFNLLSFNK